MRTPRVQEKLLWRVPPGTLTLLFDNAVLSRPSTYLDWLFAQAQRTLLTTNLPRKSPKDTNWITESLSSSFTEHTRREGFAAHCCLVCNLSFQSNSELENHAQATRHSAFSCTCGTSFGRYSSLARHINSNTGSGYHCGLCEDRTLPRIDKLYDHLRDGHKVSQKVLDHHRNKALGRTKKKSRPIKPAPTPVATSQVTYVGGFDGPWAPSGQTNGMAGRHTMTITPLSPNGVDPAHLTVSSLVGLRDPAQESRRSVGG